MDAPDHEQDAADLRQQCQQDQAKAVKARAKSRIAEIRAKSVQSKNIVQ